MCVCVCVCARVHTVSCIHCPAWKQQFIADCTQEKLQFLHLKTKVQVVSSSVTSERVRIKGVGHKGPHTLLVCTVIEMQCSKGTGDFDVYDHNLTETMVSVHRGRKGIVG